VEHPALGHIEKFLADTYRKEIDQEENVWRSLPFFAATLALELAALFNLSPDYRRSEHMLVGRRSFCCY
jgi:hypothetical protein